MNASSATAAVVVLATCNVADADCLGLQLVLEWSAASVIRQSSLGLGRLFWFYLLHPCKFI